MRHFSDKDLLDLNTGNYLEYEQFFNKHMLKRLPAAFKKEYKKAGKLHDWYFSSMLIANSGLLIKTYSREKTATVELGFISGDDKQLLIIYKNVSSYQAEYLEGDNVSRFSPTGFGRCLSSRFDLADDKSIWHGYLFEGGTIELKFEEIKLQKVK